MFKKVLLVLTVTALAFGLSGGVVAAMDDGKEAKSPLSMSLRGNIINSDIFCDSAVDLGDADSNETGFGLGVALEYDLPLLDLSIEGAIDRLNFCDYEIVDPSTVTIASNEFDSTDLSLSLKYNFYQLGEYRLVPYVLGGVGYMFNDWSLFDVDNSLETHVGAGLNFLINDSWTLYAEGRYLWSEADVLDSLADELNSIDRYKVDLDSYVGMFGLKYRF